MNGSSLFVFVTGLLGGTWAGAAIVTAIRGEEQVVLWLILALLAGILIVLYRCVREISGMNAFLFGNPKEGREGIIYGVLNKKYFLERSVERLTTHENALRSILQYNEGLARAAADSNSHEEFRQRVQALSNSQNGELEKLRKQVRLMPFRVVSEGE